MSEESRNDGTIRLLFEMAREDNPPLYDELVRFAKGSKRVNRLRLLAHEGLRALSGLGIAPSAHVTAPGTPSPSADIDRRACATGRSRDALTTSAAHGGATS